MSQSTYSLRPRNQLDYALLNSGKQLQFPVYDISPLKASPDPNEDGLSSNRDAAPAPLTSDPGEEFMELQKLLTQAKEENEALEKTFQLEAMRQELQALRLRNEQLDRRRHATPSINGGAKLLREDPNPAQVLQDLRSKKSLSTRVDKFLATLEDSSSEEDSDGKDHIPVSRGRRHTLKSGKDSKITSRVLSPQLWPHSHLSLSHISKEKKYDDLSLAEFAAGCAAILQRPTLSPLELCARIDHFAALMYLATHYTWSSVRDLHAAVLFENVIEQSRVILLLIWNLAFYNHCQDLRVREVELHARKILRPYSSVVIFSMARVNTRKITLARFVVNVNGFSTFVPGAGSTLCFSHVIQSSQRSVPCS